ncbi:pilus assembly protein TadE [Caulobacter sp. Root655]|uniref:TadE/TadG family type IV pilus assembly protein n=1 Tax=Caulobacter sp. Root655 TaxID=1736578 RepID=UPI0006FB08A7|nr:TadE/TadG family type IV pilus assembly protein [Caulobacter sp. Root655]KRA66072.1 pilus assembly protein TadE [Caulobacter sp. Root655]
MADQSRPNRSPARSGLMRRFARAQEGATAVEFAFVAIPFFGLIFAILELGLVFLVSITLENALINIDRQIRTGEFKNSAGAKEAFKAAVCAQMPVPKTSCDAAITLDVRVLPAFTGSNDLKRPPAGGACWNPGGANSIVLVRGYYKWPVITPLLQGAVASADGHREITFAAVFRNEPYDTEPVPEVKCADDT